MDKEREREREKSVSNKGKIKNAVNINNIHETRYDHVHPTYSGKCMFVVLVLVMVVVVACVSSKQCETLSHVGP